MSTPTGLLRWGQAGRYSGWDDRVVITALGGRRTGVVVPVRMAAAPGVSLAITVEAGWLAVAPCGDGTTAVITASVAVLVPVAPGDGEADRTDELVAQIADPEAATWTMAVQPAGFTEGALLLGWVHVPADATSAHEMRLEARPQDFSTGGAIPGPVGPPGPPGPPGQATLIVGTFRNRTPDELPPDGFIEAGWDAPGNPANDVQVEVGWSVVYEPDGTLWTYVTEAGIGGPWLSPGAIVGPAGPPGPAGPAGPPGPATLRLFSDDAVIMAQAQSGTWLATTHVYTVPAAEVRAGRWFVVEAAGVAAHVGSGLSLGHRLGAGMGTRYIDISGSLSSAGDANAENQYFISYRAVYQVVSGGAQVLHWTEGILGRGPNRRLHGTWAANQQYPGTQELLNNSQAPALVSNVGTSPITPGADLVMGLQCQWGRNTGSPWFRTEGSRCYWFMPEAAP